MAVKVKPKKKKKKVDKGVTEAKKRYTKTRKAKMAELRAAKTKKIREFNARTKQMPATERAAERKKFKERVNGQFKKLADKFPTERKLKGSATAAVLALIRQLEALKHS